MNKNSTALDLRTYGLEIGNPQIKSVGPIVFGPEGILFVGDNVSATIFAIDVSDPDLSNQNHSINLENIDIPLSSYLGCDRTDLLVRDIAVHPKTQNIYLAVMRGTGDESQPVLVKVQSDGSISCIDLANIAYSKIVLEDAPDVNDPRIVSRDPLRTVTVTDICYVNGTLLIAGASNEEFSSSLRRIPFPFDGTSERNSLEIFHVSHGKYETAAPIRTFVPYQNNTSLLASYTCTPVVQFSLKDLEDNTHLMGKTVAELGAHNRPLDIVSYNAKGEEFLLISNANHPLTKIACQHIDTQGSLTVPDRSLDDDREGPLSPLSGVPREELPHIGVRKLANLNGTAVLMYQEDDSGMHLRSYETSQL
jgi:hypothetical protein